MESFFHTLKTELVHHKNYATREEAKRDLFQYIEGFYNRQRIHSAIGYLTPEQMEQKSRLTTVHFFKGRSVAPTTLFKELAVSKPQPELVWNLS